MKRLLLALAMVVIGAQAAHSQTADMYITGAKVRMSKNKWNDARKVLAEQLPNFPDNPEMHYLYAINLARVSADSNPKAIRHLVIADSLNGDPGVEDELQSEIDQAKIALWGPMVNDGVRLLSAGNIDEAEATLRSAVDVMPDGKEGWLALGAVYQTKEEYELAIEHYERSLEIDPEYKTALVRLGQTYQAMAEERAAAGDMDGAQSMAGKAAGVYADYLAKNPEDIEIKIQFAALHAATGNIEAAEPIIREILDSEAVDVEVFTEFGFRLASNNQLPLAEEVLVKAVTMSDSLSTAPLSYLAYVRMQTGDLEGAQAVLTKQLELDPDNAEAWEYLAYVRRDLGDTEGAQAAFQRVEEIPLNLDGLRMSQNSDRSWSVTATFSNRQEEPVQSVRVKMSLVSAAGQILESHEVSVGDEALGAGEAESVTVDFAAPADNPSIRYEIL